MTGTDVRRSMSQAGGLPGNWGRWGEDDERGTLNLVTDEVRARAAREVRTGRSVSLALPIHPAPLLSGPFARDTAEESPVQLIIHGMTGVPVNPLAIF